MTKSSLILSMSLLALTACPLTDIEDAMDKDQEDQDKIAHDHQSHDQDDNGDSPGLNIDPSLYDDNGNVPSMLTVLQGTCDFSADDGFCIEFYGAVYQGIGVYACGTTGIFSQNSCPQSNVLGACVMDIHYSGGGSSHTVYYQPELSDNPEITPEAMVEGLTYACTQGGGSFDAQAQ